MIENTGTLFCVGRNYALHAAELGNSVPTEPMIFLKPRGALLEDGGTVVLPKGIGRVDHEVEVVLEVGKKWGGEGELNLHSLIRHVGVGVDVTARSAQSEAKKEGKPWTLAKGLRTFAPISNWISSEDLDFSAGIPFLLEVNGELRQKGNTQQMIFSFETLLRYLGTRFGIYPGDLIFTGTPQGVGPLQPGDDLVASIPGTEAKLRVSVAEADA